MKEEKCFMKKIIKGEIMESKDLIALNLEKEFVSKGYIQPLFESEYEILSRSDSDSEKQGIKNRNIYEEMRILEAAFD